MAKTILDYASWIGTAAKLERVDKSQLEQLIASLEAYGHDKYCLLVTAAFAKRQAARGHLRQETAKAVSVAMKDLYDKGAGKELARVLLGLAKWVFEASGEVKKSVNKFDTLVELLSGARE